MLGFLRLFPRAGHADDSHVADHVAAPAPPECGATPTDTIRLHPVHTGKHRSTLRWAPPEEHAAAILEFLQGPGGRTGTIPFTEMKLIHGDVCHELNIEPCGWNPVGEELRELTGGAKSYGYDVKGKRIRVYRIPPREPRSSLRVLQTAVSR